MSRLSIYEFEKFFSNVHPKRYLFSTADQVRGYDGETFYMTGSYQSATAYSQPNQIFFKGNEQTMCLSGVKYIEVNDETNANTGIAFEVICSDTKSGKDIGYKFVTD